MRRYGQQTKALCLLAATAWLLPATSSAAVLQSVLKPDTAPASRMPAPSRFEETTLKVTGGRAGRSFPFNAQGGQPGPASQVAFEHLSVEHGLSQSSVNCVLQDSRGFMWFGTNDGLNRYDGYEFVVYHADPEGDGGLSHDAVTSLVEGEADELWIGTRGGLDRLDLETGHFEHHRSNEDDPHSLIDDEILALYQDREQTLWVGTASGLDRFDRQAGHFVHYRSEPDDPRSLPDNRVMSIHEDSFGILWVGTWSGLARRDPGVSGFKTYRLAPEDVTHLGHNAVQTIVEDSGGTLWVGTGGSGFYRFHREREQFSQLLVDPADVGGFAHNDVRSICEDQAGRLWLGTDGGGLHQLDRDGQRLVPYQKDPHDTRSLSSNYVNAVYESRHGVLWIGTSGGGISKLDRDRQKFTLYQADPSEPDSLSHNRVLALCDDGEGGLWVGMDGGGLDRLDRASGKFTHYTHDPDDSSSLSNNCVTAIHQGEDGDLWVGTWGSGIARFDRETGRFVHYQADPFDPHSLSNNLVHAVFEDHEGIVWVGTDAGLDRYDPAVDRFVKYVGTGGAFRAILEDPSQDLWFATDDGLALFDRERGRMVRFRDESGMLTGPSDNTVNAVHLDRSGVVWIGTQSGLSRFDLDAATYKHYGESDGLADNVVQAILQDDEGDLWVSTAGGLSRFDPDSGVFRNYDVSDGLHGYEFTGASCQSSDGMMFFGGINGFNAFAPDGVEDNPYPPNVLVTSITQGGREVVGGRAIESVTDIRLAWPNNLFEFGFVALNYHQPEKNQYAYMLEGFDRDWVTVGTRRFGRYTNLPGGTYTLRVRGSNNDGIWNEEGVSVRVTVVPPFWATAWFRIGAVAVVVVGAAAGYQLRVRGLEARSRDLERLAADRTVALSRANELLRQEIAERERAEEALARRAAEAAVAAERSRLARELHDAVTQLLFSASLIAEALPGIWENDVEEGRELLAELRRLSRGALAEMRTLLLELRPAALTETRLAELLHQLAEAAAGRTDVSVKVKEDGEPSLPRDVHVALYRIAQEALNNVIKHAHAKHAEISLRCTPYGGGEDGRQQVTLSVRDDGRGFDPARMPPDHMGLGIIRERADRIGAELGIESQTGRGTEVMVRWIGPRP